MQSPLIAGVGGGVGTSILAAALHAQDCGIYRGGRPVHVLVCRSTMSSIGNAQRALAAAPEPPALAVVEDIPGTGLPQAVRARLRMSEPHLSATVVLPFVPGWRDVDDPWAQASRLLFLPEPPRAVREFVRSLRQLLGSVIPRMQSTAPAPVPDRAAAAWPAAAHH
jgi:hypothetical protein